MVSSPRLSISLSLSLWLPISIFLSRPLLCHSLCFILSASFSLSPLSLSFNTYPSLFHDVSASHYVSLSLDVNSHQIHANGQRKGKYWSNTVVISPALALTLTSVPISFFRLMMMLSILVLFHRLSSHPPGQRLYSHRLSLSPFSQVRYRTMSWRMPDSEME